MRTGLIIAAIMLGIAGGLFGAYSAVPTKPRADLVGHWYGESIQSGRNVAYLNEKKADGSFNLTFYIYDRCNEVEINKEKGAWQASWAIYRTRTTARNDEQVDARAGWNEYLLVYVGRDVMYYYWWGGNKPFKAKRVPEDFAVAGCYKPLGGSDSRLHSP